MQPKIKAELWEIWLTESCDASNKALHVFLARFLAKYPATMKQLEKDQEELLAFYNFLLLVHWGSIRTTNSIESAF
ncbi:MAG: transposase [Arsenophonus sp. NEOnobi-MAG3]